MRDGEQRQVAPGVLHHLKQVGSGRFAGEAVPFPHLLRRHRGNFDSRVREESHGVRCDRHSV